MADRLFDNITSEAVKKYQAVNNIPVTGIIDNATRDMLNQTLSQLRNSNDKQYAKALEALSLFND